MSEPKNPMEILSDAELETEFKMNKNFISRHSKEMGSRGRPRRFMRVNVERFVAVYFSGQLMEELEKKAKELRIEELWESSSRSSFPSGEIKHMGPGKILGKGGKQKGVAA